MAISDNIHFIKAFARNPGKVGAIAPSSPSLARAMVDGLCVGMHETIVEFGTGTGPLTEAIVPVLEDVKSYLGIERDPRFVKLLRKRFPQLRIIEGSAEHAKRWLDEHGMPPVKVVLSGLPFASLPPPVQDAIMHSLDELMPPGSQFRTFQYVHSYPLPAAQRFRRIMRNRFGPLTRSKVVLRNLPPAYVLMWQR